MIHDAHGWWLAQEPVPEPAPALISDEHADVVVIGGGFTGLWTAWLIQELEPNAKVAVLESAVCGSGPSGRNGGFVNSMWFSLASMRERFGDPGALAVAHAAQAAVDEIGTWCSDQDVDAGFRRGGYLQVSTAPAFDDVWSETVDACGELGEAGVVTALDPALVRARCDSPLFRAGAFFPGSATVNPARLVLGLRARVIDAGIRIFEHSPAIGLDVGPDSVRVRTAAGSVLTPQAVLASGGAQEAIGPLRRRLTLTSSHMVVTEPVPELLDRIGWRGGECITDARHMLHYFRTTDDDRIAFGWGGGRVVPGVRMRGHAEVDAGLAAAVIRHLIRFFPELTGTRIDHAWGGPIDVSPSHTPIVGTLDGRVHHGFGFTGNGVGPSRMVAHSLAALALDRRDEHSRLPIVEPKPLLVPPEPLRYVGGMVIREALLNKERAQEMGHRPNPIARLIAAIPERVGIQIGR